MDSAIEGKVAIQYKTKIVTEDETFKGKAFFKGTNSKTFANAGLKGGKINLYGGVLAEVSYTNDTWYTVMIVSDPTAQTYDVYLDGVLIKEAQTYHNADNGLLKLNFQIEATGIGTAYFDDVTVSTVVE